MRNAAARFLPAGHLLPEATDEETGNQTNTLRNVELPATILAARLNSSLSRVAHGAIEESGGKSEVTVPAKGLDLGGLP